MLLPRQKVPDLSVPTLDHGDFDLSAETPELGTIVCFYRGLHCPLCATYLAELERLTPEFETRGIATFALSTDGEDRTRAMGDKIKAEHLRIGYNLSLAKAREWGLYVSTSRGKSSIGIEEPALFSEPGLFLITPQQTLYYAAVQTMPFVRPHFSDLLAAVDSAIKKQYPARGEYTGPV
jgi:peroxiredoxin